MLEAIGTASTIVSLGGILSGLRICCNELRALQEAWRNGLDDLQMFSVDVQLFRKALTKVQNIIVDDQKQLKQLELLGQHIILRLESFLDGFRDLLETMDQSKLSKLRTRFLWYWRRTGAENLQRMIANGYTCLEFWAGIEQIASLNAHIKFLSEYILTLQSGRESVEHLQAVVYVRMPVYVRVRHPSLRSSREHLEKKCYETKQKCRRRIKKMKREERDRRNAETETVLMRVVDEFYSQNIVPLIRENKADLKTETRHRRFKDHPKEVSSKSGRETRRAPSQDVPLRPMTQTESRDRSEQNKLHCSPTTSSYLRSIDEDLPTGNSLSREIPSCPPPHSITSLPPSKLSELEDGSEALQAERTNHGSTSESTYQDNVDATNVDPDHATGEDVEMSPEAVQALPATDNTDQHEAAPSSTGVPSSSSSSTEGSSPSSSNAGVVQQEHRRDIEYKSNEYTESEFRKKREMKRREQEEGEARLAGRPRGRHEARKSQSHRLRRERRSLRDEKPPRDGEE